MSFTVAPDLMPKAAVDVSDVPFAVPAEIVVDLPFPPSVNRIWRAQRRPNGRKVQVAISPEYRAWKGQADSLVILNRQAPRGRTIEGPFEAHLGLNVDEGRLGDIDNRIKAALDYAQSREFIKNDTFCRRLTIEWVEHALAPHGCRLRLWACQ